MSPFICLPWMQITVVTLRLGHLTQQLHAVNDLAPHLRPGHGTLAVWPQPADWIICCENRLPAPGKQDWDWAGLSTHPRTPQEMLPRDRVTSKDSRKALCQFLHISLQFEEKNGGAQFKIKILNTIACIVCLTMIIQTSVSLLWWSDVLFNSALFNVLHARLI
jgi:hypothetical protein